MWYDVCKEQRVRFRYHLVVTWQWRHIKPGNLRRGLLGASTVDCCLASSKRSAVACCLSAVGSVVASSIEFARACVITSSVRSAAVRVIRFLWTPSRLPISQLKVTTSDGQLVGVPSVEKLRVMTTSRHVRYCFVSLCSWLRTRELRRILQVEGRSKRQQSSLDRRVLEACDRGESDGC